MRFRLLLLSWFQFGFGSREDPCRCSFVCIKMKFRSSCGIGRQILHSSPISRHSGPKDPKTAIFGSTSAVRKSNTAAQGESAQYIQGCTLKGAIMSINRLDHWQAKVRSGLDWDCFALCSVGVSGSYWMLANRGVCWLGVSVCPGPVISPPCWIWRWLSETPELKQSLKSSTKSCRRLVASSVSLNMKLGIMNQR